MIIMDIKGYVEMLKDGLKVLELGMYYVIESKVSVGFVNMFKLVKVVLVY